MEEKYLTNWQTVRIGAVTSIIVTSAAFILGLLIAGVSIWDVNFVFIKNYFVFTGFNMLFSITGAFAGKSGRETRTVVIGSIIGSVTAMILAVLAVILFAMVGNGGLILD